MKDLVIFFGLYVIQIVTFAAVGILIFGDVPDYDNIFGTSLMFFQYTLGGFDLKIYDNCTESRRMLGILYSCLVLIVNMLVLINLLIALMQDTYRMLSKMKRGLLFKQIIQAVPCYKYENQYSCLISIPMPLNVVTIFILPVMVLVKDPSARKRINRVILMITYTPIALLSIAVFFTVNVILLPMAFVKALLHKLLIVFRSKKKEHLAELINFTFIGLPVMLSGQAVELKEFVVHLYNWD